MRSRISHENEHWIDIRAGKQNPVATEPVTAVTNLPHRECRFVDASVVNRPTDEANTSGASRPGEARLTTNR